MSSDPEDEYLQDMEFIWGAQQGRGQDLSHSLAPVRLVAGEKSNQRKSFIAAQRKQHVKLRSKDRASFPAILRARSVRWDFTLSFTRFRDREGRAWC
jgi:hypothetical protein